MPASAAPTPPHVTADNLAQVLDEAHRILTNWGWRPGPCDTRGPRSLRRPKRIDHVWAACTGDADPTRRSCTLRAARTAPCSPSPSSCSSRPPNGPWPSGTTSPVALSTRSSPCCATPPSACGRPRSPSRSSTPGCVLVRLLASATSPGHDLLPSGHGRPSTRRTDFPHGHVGIRQRSRVGAPRRDVDTVASNAPSLRSNPSADTCGTGVDEGGRPSGRVGTSACRH